MSLVLILAGAALVCIAMFNRVPRLVPATPGTPRAAERNGRVAAPPHRPRATQRGPRLAFVPARLTETGRAVLTTVGGSVLIAAFFLALSGS
ncbi:hypothetical protein CDO52_08415 [Nocardiopsis gilva YIM 90087]|uniref:Uncharacterized protein n=1 Tax=Nocardiopsis gilva YIM 90087 TaxID=1235441 RepID=A0A223S3W5_9ACTN|nr:hypothetical protein [Nocardiopsis gilva]ASU82801.1 hypothetical protein CDO52_08415 [Nocardiopsis gilva YIM 90087]